MPDFDPSSNGFRRRSKGPTDKPRGRGVVLVAAVCAMTGAGLVGGFVLGGLAAGLLGLRGEAFFAPVAAASALAAAVGVWLGVRFTGRLAGGSARSRRVLNWATVGGIAGLIAAVAVATTDIGPFAPVAVILLPGLGALLGESLATRRE
ncbi:MAG: hypothetical protein M3164_00870 [Actinomycetota bacterium]|nr:hypothetical protein [Actinomycetota bacterium]